jgi:hypothetical protein
MGSALDGPLVTNKANVRGTIQEIGIAELFISNSDANSDVSVL